MVHIEKKGLLYALLYHQPTCASLFNCFSCQLSLSLFLIRILYCSVLLFLQTAVSTSYSVHTVQQPTNQCLKRTKLKKQDIDR